MRVFILTLATGIFFTSSVLGQSSTSVIDWTEYFKKIKVADSLFSKEQYGAAAVAFSAAFTFNDQHFSFGDRYRAARAWAMAGNKDSALVNLKAEIKYWLPRL